MVLGKKGVEEKHIRKFSYLCLDADVIFVGNGSMMLVPRP